MRTLSIAAAALLLASAAASAQTTSPTPSPRPPGGLSGATQPPQAAVRPPAPNPLTKEDVSQIEGTGVYGSDDSKIGHVSKVLMNPQDKKIDRLVVTAGGVLGVGGHRVAMPIDQFTWDAQKGAFKLQTTEADLKQKPEWVEGSETGTGSTQPPKSDNAPTGAGH